jgi:hypothetical protein
MNTVNEMLVFRLLKEDEKDARLLAAVRALRNGSDEPVTHRVDQETFRMIPGAPFAYWVSDAMRTKFKEFPRLEGTTGAARQGLATADDFRFVRAAWEIPAAVIGQSRHDAQDGKPWIAFAKGGEFAPFYSDVHLLVNWGGEGAAIKTSVNAKGGVRSNVWMLRDTARTYFFRPGLTWPRRTDGLSVRALPAGCIFADKGPALFVRNDNAESILRVAAFLNSQPMLALVRMLLARTELAQSYEVGLVQSIPMPREDVHQGLAPRAREIHKLKRALDAAIENSHAFVLPTLLQRSAPTLAARLLAWNAGVADAATRIVAAQREIDASCYRVYGISDRDRATIEAELGIGVRGLPEPTSGAQAAADLVSWTFGVVLGRFDVRLATVEEPLPELADPFAPLPTLSPGMLPDGGPPSGYPIPIDADGILVDDEPHADDVVRRVRDVFRLLWGDHADAVEKETCALLGTKALRDYFAKTGKGGFWDDHFHRYSKSRRKAPIYWPLESPRGLYRVWMYAHRLTRDTLPKLLGQRYLGGALAGVKHAIEELRPAGQTKADLTKKQEGRLAGLEELLVDLEEFTALLRAAFARTNDQRDTVGYAPDLNDGVVLAAAPLHQLIPWPKTRKQGGKTISELQAYWEELEQGDYDWAHVAMLYWPTRVTEKCRKDKSLALAHGLDGEFFPSLRDELRRQAEASPSAEDADAEGDLTDNDQDEE